MSEPKVNLQGGGRTDNFGRLNAIYVNIKRMFGIPTGTAEYLLGLDENQNLVKTVDGGGGGAGLVDGDYGDITVSGTGTVMTIDNNAVDFSKIQQIGAYKLLGNATSSTANISELDILPSRNMPIGSILNMFGGQSLRTPTNAQALIDIAGKYVSNTSGWVFELESAITPSFSTSPTMDRRAVAKNNTGYTLLLNTSSIIQTTVDGSTAVNIKIPHTTLANGPASSTFYNDYANTKTIWIIGSYHYLYSTNGVDFSFSKSPIVSSNHVAINRPVISGSTYSFFNSTNSKRIYTTDHVTFSDCVGFETTDLQIHTLSNGHLYTHTGTTLRISTDNGVNWTSYTLPASTNNSGNHCLDYDGTTYVYGTTTNALYSSTNLTSWTSRTSSITGTPVLQRVWFVNSLWFVFSATSSTTSFSTSADGTTWTNRTWGASQSLIGNAVIYVNSLFMVLCNNRVQTSPTGVTWTDSLSSGMGDLDANTRLFTGSGTQAILIGGSGEFYIYNAGTWTSVFTSQLRNNAVSLSTTTVSNQYMKVYV